MTDQPAATPKPAEAATAPAEWKPEPRQWGWKDLFTAPMLAFKPKCMLVSAVTIVLIGLWWQLWGKLLPSLIDNSQITATGQALSVVWQLVTLLLFALGATLVAVFMKADLIDDEFLSFGEALKQYASRVAPAVLVPLFLVVLVAGVFLALIYLPMLVGSIPLVGPLLYAILYPLGWFMGVFLVLLLVAVALSLFVFPAIIAVRRHGWFDNVVDTIEAIGTKPHVLVASLAATLLMITVAFKVGMGGMTVLKTQAAGGLLPLPGTELQRTEARANDIRQECLAPAQFVAEAFNGMLQALPLNPYQSPSVLPLSTSPYRSNAWESSQALAVPSADGGNQDGFIRYGTGPILAGWQSLILLLLFGYCLNLLVGGGMLTYLVVREDDYWDDEDLEDLDQLAKELEAEAKQEEGATATAAPAPAPAPAPTAPPEPPQA